MELLALAGRVILSLVVVLVLLWLAARGLRKNQRRTMHGVDVEVLARQPLAQRSSLAIVQVGDRALVLGVTESRVELLTQAPLESLMTRATPPSQTAMAGLAPGVADPAVSGLDGHRPDVDRPDADRPAVRPGGPLAGSALSPATWSKALDAVREKTVRR